MFRFRFLISLTAFVALTASFNIAKADCAWTRVTCYAEEGCGGRSVSIPPGCNRVTIQAWGGGGRGGHLPPDAPTNLFAPGGGGSYVVLSYKNDEPTIQGLYLLPAPRTLNGGASAVTWALGGEQMIVVAGGGGGGAWGKKSYPASGEIVWEGFTGGAGDSNALDTLYSTGGVKGVTGQPGAGGVGVYGSAKGNGRMGGLPLIPVNGGFRIPGTGYRELGDGRIVAHNGHGGYGYYAGGSGGYSSSTLVSPNLYIHGGGSGGGGGSSFANTFGLAPIIVNAITPGYKSLPGNLDSPDRCPSTMPKCKTGIGGDQYVPLGGGAVVVDFYSSPI